MSASKRPTTKRHPSVFRRLTETVWRTIRGKEFIGAMGLLIVAGAAYASLHHSVHSIDRQLKRIARDDLSLLEAVTRLRVEQVEQQTLLRTVLQSVAVSNAVAESNRFDHAVSRFNQHVQQVDRAVSGIAEAVAALDQSADEVSGFAPQIIQLQAEQARLKSDVQSMMRLVQENRIGEFAGLEEITRNDAEQVSQRIDALWLSVRLSIRSSASSIEKDVFILFWTCLAAAAAVAMIISWYHVSARRNSERHSGRSSRSDHPAYA